MQEQPTCVFYRNLAEYMAYLQNPEPYTNWVLNRRRELGLDGRQTPPAGQHCLGAFQSPSAPFCAFERSTAPLGAVQSPASIPTRAPVLAAHTNCASMSEVTATRDQICSRMDRMLPPGKRSTLPNKEIVAT